MKKNLVRVITGILSSVILFTACTTTPKEGAVTPTTEPSAGATATDKPSDAVASTGEITVEFWSAPNAEQFKYWSAQAETFNAQKIAQDGKTIKVLVQQMPESPSSEAGIQNAIATASNPAISENINRGFAAILAQSDVVYNLEEESWFKDILATRDMGSAIEGWAIDSKQYVLPIYINPICYQWNMVGLRALGVTTPPTTVDEMKNVIELFRAQKETTMKDLGINATFYRPSFNRPDQWWEAWFDFQTQYASFNNGDGSWVDGDKLVLKEDIAKETLEFYGLLGDTMIMSELSTLWTADQVPYIFSISAPWDIKLYKEAGKTYGLEGDYVYAPPIVKKAGDKYGSFGDSKGLVLYKTDNITPEVHDAAVTYLKWLYSPENSAKTDLEWLKATKMLPVRGDISKNEVFKEFLADSVELQELSKFIPFSFPSMANAKMTEIQGALLEFGLAPYMNEAIKGKDFNVIDATPYVKKAFEQMKTVGELK